MAQVLIQGLLSSIKQHTASNQNNIAHLEDVPFLCFKTFFFSLVFFTYLTDKVTELFNQLIHSPLNACKNWSWDKPKPGTQSSMRASCRSGRDQSPADSQARWQEVALQGRGETQSQAL